MKKLYDCLGNPEGAEEAVQSVENENYNE